MFKTLAVFLLLCQLSFEQFGFDLPEKYTYRYYEEFNREYIQRVYILQETLPQSVFLCPKNSFILRVKYNLIQRVGEPFAHELKGRVKNNQNSSRDICPTLSLCLGYQACLFNFGLEFCGWDPLPGERKLFNVTVDCYSDNGHGKLALKNGEHLKKRDEVINLAYISKLEEGNHNYSNINLKPYVLPENEVFDIGCADVESSSSFGYKGVCLQKPKANNSITEDIWHVLARARSKTCRNELIQVYCAIQYNGIGLCVPPLFLNPEVSTFSNITFNFRSLPKRGARPEQKKDTQNGIHESLLPVRLAFNILVHKDADAVVQLLELIYRRQHFYCIHIDVNKGTFRKELESKLFDFLQESGNVRILPRERSFSCSWGSYEVLRAELECFEELLRMGTWDFEINLSGADLPLRNVDDLAAALAPQRGNIFIPAENVMNSVTSKEPDMFISAMHCCDRFVYNVTRMSGLPNYSELKLHMGATWGAFSRDFLEYVLNTDKRSSVLNKYQFFMQLMIVPDEFYLITAMFSSEFKGRVRTNPIHSTKTFKGNNELNLCRHMNDADFCGQGPDVIHEEDLHILTEYSHERFFVRKFQTSSPNSVERIAVINSMNHYYDSIQHYIPPVLIRQLALNVISRRFEPGYNLIDVVDVKILPNLSPSKIKCETPFYGKLPMASSYKYWIEFTMMKPDSEEVKLVRAALNVKPSHECFKDSHLQMMYATTWTIIDPAGEKTALDSGVPVPFSPVRENIISIQLYFNVDDRDIIEDNFKLMFENLNTKNVSSSPLKIHINLSDPFGKDICSETQEVFWNEGNVLNNEYLPFAERNEMLWPAKLTCPSLKSGKHTLSLSKAGIEHSEVHSLDLYLLDTENVAYELRKDIDLKNIANLWSVQEASVISTKKVQQRKKTHFKNVKTDSHPPGVTCSLPSFSKWLVCCGGLLTLFFGAVIFFYWFYMMSTSSGLIRRKTRKKFIFFLLMLIIVVTIQIYLFQ